MASSKSRIIFVVLIVLLSLIVVGCLIVGIIFGLKSMETNITKTTTKMTSKTSTSKQTISTTFVSTITQSNQTTNQMTNTQQVSNSDTTLAAHNLTGTLEPVTSVATHVSNTTTTFISSSTSKERCPRNWIEGGSSCYLIIQNTANRTIGQQTCEENESKLVVIETQIEFDFLVRIYDNLKHTPLWLGAQAETNKQFKWSDGSILDLNSPFWCIDEPNDYQNNEKCLVFNRNCLNDIPCNENRSTICEKMIF